MKRILVCDTDKATRSKMRSAIENCAAQQHVTNLEVMFASSPASMSSLFEKLRDGLFNAVVCRWEDEGAEEALVQLRTHAPSLPIVIVSTDAENALRAIELDARFFCLADGTKGFTQSIGKLIEDIGKSHQEMLAIRSPGGIHNVPLDDVLFAESTKRGPRIHLVGEQVISTRGTLQALADRLQEVSADRFIKVGGSFVVNLDNVRSFGDAALIFSDGETIIAPVRRRKEVKAIYEAYLAPQSA